MYDIFISVAGLAIALSGEIVLISSFSKELKDINSGKEQFPEMILPGMHIDNIAGRMIFPSTILILSKPYTCLKFSILWFQDIYQIC